MCLCHRAISPDYYRNIGGLELVLSLETNFEAGHREGTGQYYGEETLSFNGLGVEIPCGRTAQYATFVEEGGITLDLHDDTEINVSAKKGFNLLREGTRINAETR